MQLAFLQIVSGMEDLKDSEEKAQALAPEDDKASILTQHAQTLQAAEEAERKMAMFNLYSSVVTRFSMSPETAIDGWYVTTRPRLGLAAV